VDFNFTEHFSVLDKDNRDQGLALTSISIDLIISKHEDNKYQ
jgi:hypothetical protein